MEEWEIRKKHSDDIQATHQKLGHLDERGRMRIFRGKLFFEEIKKLGHTASELQRCKCWIERFLGRKFTGHA